MHKNAKRNSPAKADTLLRHPEDFARQKPTEATLSAFGAGLLLNFLPLGAIAARVVDAAFWVMRPALLSLGLLKALELFRKNNPSKKSHE